MGREHPRITVTGDVNDEEDDRWAAWTKLSAEVTAAVTAIITRPEFADIEPRLETYEDRDYTPTGTWVDD